MAEQSVTYIVNGQRVDAWGNPAGEKEVVADNAATNTPADGAQRKPARRRPQPKKDA